jgi:hypothetical protein
MRDDGEVADVVDGGRGHRGFDLRRARPAV